MQNRQRGLGAFSFSLRFLVFLDVSSLHKPFKRQSHKMANHTQAIRRQFADELFECVWSFYEIDA